jgi:hypothetical protein
MTKLRLGVNVDHVATLPAAAFPLPQTHFAALNAFAPSRKGRGDIEAGRP